MQRGGAMRAIVRSFLSLPQRRERKEMQAVERYKGFVGIAARWLVESGVMSASSYKHECARGHIRVLRRGCKGVTALVDYGTMPLRLKARVAEILGGDPVQVAESNSLLREAVMRRMANVKDMDAWDYFASLTDAAGKRMEEGKVKELANSVKILNAITEVLGKIEAAAAMRRQRFSVKREFERFGWQVENDLTDVVNTLPTSGDRLYKKWKEFKAGGMSCLVHGLYGTGGKKDEKGQTLEAIVGELTACGAKLTDEMVARLAGTLGIETNRRRVQEVRAKSEVVNMASREGKRVYENSLKMQVDRIRPSQPMLMWCSDGWDAELYYRDEKSRYNRLTIVVVIDTFNDYPMGYAIGERECGALIQAAYRSAINHAEELFGEAVMPWQIQSDNYAKGMLEPYYSAICREFTPARVGNAKDKVIEPYFRTIQSKLQLMPNYSGHNITAKRQPNDDYTNERAKDFPTREVVERELHALMNIERKEKRDALLSAWAKRDEGKVTKLDRCKYLERFGERTRGNMLTPNGIKVIRGGKEYKFECEDIKMREMRGERWTVCFDLWNMNHAVAVSEDGRTAFELHAKQKVHMALADRTEEDEIILTGYGEFNKKLETHIAEERVKRQEIVNEYITKQQLAGTLAARLLTEGGQHKDKKAEERQRLARQTEKRQEEEGEELVIVKQRKGKTMKEKLMEVYENL